MRWGLFIQFLRFSQQVYWGGLHSLLQRQETYDKHRQCIEKQRNYSANKGPYNQGYGLPSGLKQVWELYYKEGRKNKQQQPQQQTRRQSTKESMLQTVVLEKTPESLLDCKEFKPVNLKGNQPWILIGRTDAEAEASVFWSTNVNSRLIWKVPDPGKDWGQKEKRLW